MVKFRVKAFLWKGSMCIARVLDGWTSVADMQAGKVWGKPGQSRQSLAKFTLKSADSSGRESSHFHLEGDLQLTFMSHFFSQDLLSLLNCVASHCGIRGSARFVTYRKTSDSFHFFYMNNNSHDSLELEHVFVSLYRAHTHTSLNLSSCT